MSYLADDSPGTIPGISFDITSFLKGSVVLFVLGFISVCVYNIFFHPLRNYPGPKYAAATDLVFKFASLRGDVVPWTHRIHEKYGEAVRLGPNRLSFISPQAWKDIYGHRTGGKKSNPKDVKFYTPEPNGEPSIFAITADDEHSVVRRIFSAAFSDKALKQQEPLVRTYIDQLIQAMRNASETSQNSEIDIVRLLNFATFDIIGDLTFGEPLGLLQRSDYTPWVTAIFDGIKAGAFINNMQEYAIGRFALGLIPALREKRKAHFDHTAERVDRRLVNGSEKPDFWNLILGSNKGKMTVPQMHAHGAVFMLAGTETTATLLSGLVYLLLKNPDKMQKLVEEVRQIQSEEDLTFENLARMQYLAACLQEGFRCYPPVAVGLPRVTPPGGNSICGKWVPENARVSVPQWAAYHSRFNFQRPNEFIPERWLPGNGFDSDNKDIVQPFSIGPRNCLGKNLAYHEIRLVLAKILWHFDVKLGEQSHSWMEQKVWVLWKKEELMVGLNYVQ